MSGLNPYCSGRWSRTYSPQRYVCSSDVLILIVVEDGLVPHSHGPQPQLILRLNPYCSGRWSRTRPYKTLLIINKLKNFTKQVFTFLNRKLTIS